MTSRAESASARASEAAGAGARTGVVFRHEVPPAVRAAILDTLAEVAPWLEPAEARLRSRETTAGAVAGHYRLSTPSAEWFVRVTERAGDPSLERRLVEHLAAEGVAVDGQRVVGARLEWKERSFRLDVRPFVEAHHFEGSPVQVAKLAATLRRCHVALARFPERDAIRARAAGRAQRLEGARGRIAEALAREEWALFGDAASWARAHRGWLADLVGGIEANLHERPDAQCVHGEIHQGNVLFRVSDGAPVLVDFEESVHLFVPAAWDLAFLVQRFCLADEPSPDRARQCLREVAAAYGSAPPALAPLMRQAAWLAIATIVDLRVSRGAATPVAEHDKFVRLERQARALERVL